jgi:hypothetical protein
VTRLHITIEDMATLAAEFAESILRWASRLPYPWCARDALKQDAPDIETVQRVVTQLTR